ncbi:MAG: flagellar hook assembly protein FlgD [Tepidamorphaceae bacterium]
MILDALSSAPQTGSAAKDRAGIADNFDTFLQILTTQLKNQNPLEPLDTNEFTAQLVQFSQVEQQIKQNDNLESIAKLSAAAAATNAVGFIGKRVEVFTTVTDMTDGSAKWTYTAAEKAKDALFTIRDADGKVVWTGEQDISAGRDDFVWDGRNTDGVEQPDGKYILSISATNSDERPCRVAATTQTTIDGVDFNGDEPLLLASDTAISLAAIKRIFSQ